MRKRDPHETFELMGSLTRRIRAVAEGAYSAFEVGTAQAKFLRHIGKHRGISQADLARATVTAPTLTGRAIDPLVERGWVRRKRSDEDRRQYVLELTAEGRRVTDRIEEARARIIARFDAAIDDRDVADFERIAKKLFAAFEE
jgi:DNA-binding MarR family transcriptional regulator